MKIALLSDIHANLPALEAAFAHIEKQKPDAVYCLGDLIGYNTWPNEVIREIRARKIATLAGNHDLKVLNLKAVNVNELQESGKKYAYHIVGKQERNYLLTLPAHIRLEFKLNNDTLNILLVHGSPRSVDEYVLEDTEETYVLQLMEEAQADILCVGHSHKPYHRIIQAASGSPKHIINTGSIGKPKDNNPFGGYVMLELSEAKSGISNENIKVDFLRFEYDVEKAAQAIEQSPLPNEFADRLRKAY
ncbi:MULTISPECIES: metallophosphoesterase family protein [Olivibacter]|uniref:Metallophosphoesterase family protein n=1 Tax=Olivibacter jilunii TaxID=985016 RepID=A0ABW6B4L2_9SPHI